MHNVNLQNLHRKNFCGGQSFEDANDHIFEWEDRYLKGVNEAIYVYCEWPSLNREDGLLHRLLSTMYSEILPSHTEPRLSLHLASCDEAHGKCLINDPSKGQPRSRVLIPGTKVGPITDDRWYICAGADFLMGRAIYLCMEWFVHLEFIHFVSREYFTFLAFLFYFLDYSFIYSFEMRQIEQKT